MTELPKHVLQRLATSAAPAEHPAADLLAAFVEQRLAGAEREKLLAHLADCYSCREVVWRSLPASESSAAVPASAGGRRLWAPAWRWVGVAAAVVVMAGVALVYRGGPGAAGEKSASGPPAPAVAARRDAQSLSANLPAPAVPEARLKARYSAAPAKEQLEAKAVPLKSTPAARKQSPGNQMALADLAAQSAGANPAGASARSAAAPATSDALAANTAATQPAYPVPTSATEPGVIVGSAIPTLALGKKKMAAPTLWMLSSEGQLLRSTDSGKNWQAVPFEDKVVFRAVAVVGPKVWAGGLGGKLYYSSDDGSQWTRLSPSDSVRLNEDIRALIFQDSRHGNLTTASGQTWATSDGGRSWQKQ